MTEHKTEIHRNPLNDGTAWYRVTCSCGWANADSSGAQALPGGLRIYSQETAELVRDKHLDEVTA